MATKVRLFICTKGNGRGIFEGQTLEIYGSMFMMHGYYISHIKTYKDFYNSTSKWKEVRTIKDLTEEERNSVYIKRLFLEHIPVV